MGKLLLQQSFFLSFFPSTLAISKQNYLPYIYTFSLLMPKPPFSPTLKNHTNMLSTKRLRLRTPEESSTQESSAHIIASSSDLLSELLLLRLPIKSLLKFKSVSKHWLSLITHPQFCRRKNHNPNPISALFLQFTAPPTSPLFSFVPLDHSQTTAPFTSLTFTYHHYGIEIIQSCSGLFCCSSFEYNDSERKYYIYNPTTKQFTTLPPLSGGGAVRPVLGMNLAFDPSESHVYKVVCVQRCESFHGHVLIQIYSSETGPWRLTGGPVPAPNSVDFSGGVYWNGAIHWVSPRDSSLYFDLREEIVQEMSMPPLPDGFYERGTRYFGESLGHLHTVEIYEDSTSTSQLNVYEMERDRSGWFLKFRVDLKGVAGAFPDYHEENDYYHYSFSVLCVVRGEKEEDSFLVLHIPGKFIGYNFNSKSYQEICDTDCPLTFDQSYAFQYIESLALV